MTEHREGEEARAEAHGVARDHIIRLGHKQVGDHRPLGGGRDGALGVGDGEAGADGADRKGGGSSLLIIRKNFLLQCPEKTNFCIRQKLRQN